MRQRLLYSALRNADPGLANQLDQICTEALRIWEEQHLRTYTAHGEPHIQQVEANLDALTRPLESSPQLLLRPSEIFVLLASCYLHDIGMQLDRPDARAQHAQYAYDLILYSSARIGPDVRRVTLSILDNNAREAIASLARGHWTDYALDLPQQTFIAGNSSGRLRLLGLLLATADLLDLSPVRARYYQTVQRLYDVDAVAELHQTMHNWVRGFSIEPAVASIPGDLQFKLIWRDNAMQVRDTADWVLRWLTSQWRRLHPALHEESGGSIRWSHPWFSARFDVPMGPRTSLSDAALSVLQAERAEQRRLNRDVLTGEFKTALANDGSSIFLLPSDSDWDGRAIRDWCEAYARAQPSVAVARVNVPPGGRLDRVSMIAQLMEQWGQHVPTCGEPEAWEYLRKFLAQRTEIVCVALLTLDNYKLSGVHDVLNAILCEERNGCKRRICVVLSDTYAELGSLNNVQVHQLGTEPYNEADVLAFLRGQLGYGERDAIARLSQIRTSRNLDYPGIVRDMIEQYEVQVAGLDATPHRRV